MKLYVIPTERLCNGKCAHCITKTRKQINSEFLTPKKLISALEKIKNVSFIEITGGGEPLLNKNIKEIIKICSKKAPTKLYTNAGIYNKDIPNELKELCI